MKHFFLIFTFSICLSCESPMNHRLRAENNLQKSALTQSFTNSEWTAEVQWILGPTGDITKRNTLLVVLKNQQGDLISLPDGYVLSFYASMPSMGHPLDNPGDFIKLSEGIYMNDEIRYNMDGDWKNELWILDQNLQVVDQLQWHEFL